MSGIVALLHGDGRPVDDSLVSRLTEAMGYRGPDGTTTYRSAGAAMGHARFETLDAPREGTQPLRFEERLLLVADVRLDDRAGLIAALAAQGREVGESTADEVLLAHAYDEWEASCIERLLGDFCFLIWDPAERVLFGARDHIGVKPLYYAAIGEDLLAGNTLAGLRAHPGVADELDERAIADFLLFGVNRHPERTSFAAIRRLPPAHTLHWRPGGEPHVARYWRLEAVEGLRHVAESDYVERFDELLERAVADRLRGKRCVVLMSGGLDSTAVAAVARELLCERRDEAELATLTVSVAPLMDDTEPGFATLAAEHLGLPHCTLALDDQTPARVWGPGARWTAEPVEVPASARSTARLVSALAGARVALTGHGGDPLLHIDPADSAHRAAADGLGTTALRTARYWLAHGHLPRTGLRTHWRRLQGDRHGGPLPFPPWLRSDLVSRLDLHERYRAHLAPAIDEAAFRPRAAAQLGGPEWSFVLEQYDPGFSGLPLEHRHPFLDLRVAEFLLALPVLPWLVEKEILRRAMGTRLPAAVLTRRKASLPSDPAHRILLAGAADLSDLASNAGHLAQFVDVTRFEKIATRPKRLREWESPLVTRPLGLALWLQRVESSKFPGDTEDFNESEGSRPQETLS